MSQTTITVELGTAEGNGIPLTLLATVPENKPIQPSQAATESTEVNPIPEANTRKSWVRTTIVISILAGVSFLNTMGSGILTVALPRIAEDLSLSENLLLWCV